MNRRLSRHLLIAEALLFVLPLTCLVAVALATMSPLEPGLWPWAAMDGVTLLVAVSVCSGWWLLITALRGGEDALRAAHRGWWLGAALGAVLIFAGVVSKLLPASLPYSPAAIFREHLEGCVLGLPLLVVLVHLWAEARLRKLNDQR